MVIYQWIKKPTSSGILWMGQRNGNHQLIDGKHPMKFCSGFNNPFGGLSDFAGPSTVS